eukprot:TRINITY_DN12363_c0_g1_i1.p1 TRINITY_DN12363_c0_g1~~TRINITY_DN12363_c0_g1_i1.p1  ORF type:complete len:288 (+),score=51.62 TRINITY_DN12363_c0_g1_i1:142-1005(+)
MSIITSLINKSNKEYRYINEPPEKHPTYPKEHNKRDNHKNRKENPKGGPLVLVLVDESAFMRGYQFVQLGDYKASLPHLSRSAEEGCFFSKVLLLLPLRANKASLALRLPSLDALRLPEYSALPAPPLQSCLGLYYFLKGAFPKALKHFKQGARGGDAFGQYYLGCSYAYGKGTTPQAAKALRQFLLSAQQRNSYALYQLGVLHEDGRGVPSDLLRAFSYYELSARLGNPFGLYKLGKWYKKGTVVRADASKAREYLHAAVLQGHPRSRTNMEAPALSPPHKMPLTL